MYSHDALWKGLIQAFFPDFMQLVVPKLADQLKLEECQFLEKEVFADLPKGRKVMPDLLAEVPSLDGPKQLVLVHTEVELQFGRDMDLRMARYFFHLSLKYELPIVPIVLFLRGGQPGINVRSVEHRIGGFTVNRFSYWSLGVSKTEARSWLSRGALGVALATCARGDRLSKDEQKFLCMEALLGAGVDEAQEQLLVAAIETYLALNEEQKMKYAERVKASPYQKEMQQVELTWAGKLHERGRREGLELGRRQGVEVGRQQGVELGRLEESRRMLRLILTQRFGSSAKQLESRLGRLDDRSRLEEIGRQALADASLEEIERLLGSSG